MHLLPPANAGEAWLYELGIPIQQITTPWDVDVMQKVPMPPNRTRWGDSYLQDIYAEVLNAGYGLLEGDDFAAPWVDFAIDDDRSVAPAIQATVKGRYGDQPILSGPDRDANMKAAENGHTVIHPNSLTPKERQRFKQEAKVPTAREVYGIVRTFDPRHPKFIIPLSERPELPAFEAWVKELAGYCGLKAQVVFYEHQDGHYASCTADTKNPTVHFNCANLGKDFFKKPLNRPEQLALVIHELAHALSDKPMEHGPSWGEAAAQAGAKISAGLLARGHAGNQEPSGRIEKTSPQPTERRKPCMANRRQASQRNGGTAMSRPRRRWKPPKTQPPPPPPQPEPAPEPEVAAGPSPGQPERTPAGHGTSGAGLD